MAKVDWKPGTMIYPLPAVMVTVGSSPEEYNIITISWTGTICSDPPMCYISVRPSRHSYDILKRTGEFVINLTTVDLARQTDWCGVRSGKDYNKFEEMKLTPSPSTIVKAPGVLESPVNIECQVVDVKPLGSHDMFIAKVVNVRVDDQFLDPESGKFDLESAQLVSYTHGHYYKPGKAIGKFGFSVEKKRRKRPKR